MDTLIKKSSKKATQDLAMNAVVSLTNAADYEDSAEDGIVFSFDQAPVDHSKRQFILICDGNILYITIVYLYILSIHIVRS